MGGKMLNKIADLEKMVHRKIVHHDEFCYWLKLMYLFLLHPVYNLQKCSSMEKFLRHYNLINFIIPAAIDEFSLA
jgi:hypothetical protein